MYEEALLPSLTHSHTHTNGQKFYSIGLNERTNQRTKATQSLAFPGLFYNTIKTNECETNKRERERESQRN